MTDPRFRRYKFGTGSRIIERLPCCDGVRTLIMDVNGVTIDDHTGHAADCEYERELRKHMLGTRPAAIILDDAAEPTWPFRMKVDDLIAVKETKRPSFADEYMNEPIDSKTV